MSLKGSSPLARGLRCASHACVLLVADHPRSRGVYETVEALCPDARGSSPLARGLRLDADRSGVATRIIPARAGFTSVCSTGTRTRRDHPRSRGVYLRLLDGDENSTGSSPLARGLRGTARRRRHHRWIIPARAGFTAGEAEELRCTPDHPRSRGVYSHWLRRLSPPIGSSPLARGLRLPRRVPLMELGIIPARAGFTP